MLSRQSLDILLDLVEIKLSAIMILDKDDAKEVQRLKVCRSELLNSKRSTYPRKINEDGEVAVIF
jgi:hypothetical protein